MGLMGDRRFLLITSVGFDSLVTETIERNGRNTLGYRGYFVPILTSLGRYEHVRLTVTVDETRSFTAAAVMVLKVRHYGGFFVFSKDAALDSGCFHICLFPRGSVPAIIRYGLGAFLRCTPLLRDITRITGSTVRIESDPPFAVETDGDFAGSTPVEVRLDQAAVPMIFPPEDVTR
jgi:diacylglycerol kinase family enzyme